MFSVKPITALKTYPIRLAVLRPTKTLADCVFTHDEDADTFHLGIFEESSMAGIASFYKQKNSLFTQQSQYQLRGMATLPAYQYKGLGNQLLQAGISHLKELEAKLLWCNARSSAVAFYQKAGFTTLGEEFLIKEVGPHYVMWLAL